MNTDAELFKSVTKEVIKWLLNRTLTWVAPHALKVMKSLWTKIAQLPVNRMMIPVLVQVLCLIVCIFPIFTLSMDPTPISKTYVIAVALMLLGIVVSWVNLASSIENYRKA